ncbi:MAG: hypothetical protein L0228_15110 [Planctomycetes bacterium]|nr:hypothetical protein [Planctomycetota bacterium]
MKLVCLLIPVLLLVTSVATAAPPEKKPKAVAIPLNQIWAFDMPGTRLITELEPEAYGKEAQKGRGKEGIQRNRRSLVHEIQRALRKPPPDGKDAKSCFAVLGSGPDALDLCSSCKLFR